MSNLLADVGDADLRDEFFLELESRDDSGRTLADLMREEQFTMHDVLRLKRRYERRGEWRYNAGTKVERLKHLQIIVKQIAMERELKEGADGSQAPKEPLPRTAEVCSWKGWDADGNQYWCNNHIFPHPRTRENLTVCAYHVTECVGAHPSGTLGVKQPNHHGLCYTHFVAEEGHGPELYENELLIPGVVFARAGTRRHPLAPPLESEESKPKAIALDELSSDEEEYIRELHADNQLSKLMKRLKGKLRTPAQRALDRERAAVMVQTAVRMLLAKRVVARMRRERAIRDREHACLILQRAFRRNANHKQRLLQQQQWNAAAERIQRMVRRVLWLRRSERDRRRRLAATKIQRWLRNHRVRVVLKLLRLRRTAQLSIQNRQSGLTTLNRFARNWRYRRVVKDSRLRARRERWAARVIQRAWRLHKGRLEQAEILRRRIEFVLKLRAAVRIQRWILSQWARRRAAAARQTLLGHVLTINRVVRGHLARLRVKRRRAQLEAVWTWLSPSLPREKYAEFLGFADYDKMFDLSRFRSGEERQQEEEERAVEQHRLERKQRQRQRELMRLNAKNSKAGITDSSLYLLDNKFNSLTKGSASSKNQDSTTLSNFIYLGNTNLETSSSSDTSDDEWIARDRRLREAKEARAATRKRIRELNRTHPMDRSALRVPGVPDAVQELDEHMAALDRVSGSGGVAGDMLGGRDRLNGEEEEDEEADPVRAEEKRAIKVFLDRLQTAFEAQDRARTGVLLPGVFARVLRAAGGQYDASHMAVLQETFLSAGSPGISYSNYLRFARRLDHACPIHNILVCPLCITRGACQRCQCSCYTAPDALDERLTAGSGRVNPHSAICSCGHTRDRHSVMLVAHPTVPKADKLQHAQVSVGFHKNEVHANMFLTKTEKKARRIQNAANSVAPSVAALAFQPTPESLIPTERAVTAAAGLAESIFAPKDETAKSASQEEWNRRNKIIMAGAVGGNTYISSLGYFDPGAGFSGQIPMEDRRPPPAEGASVSDGSGMLMTYSGKLRHPRTLFKGVSEAQLAQDAKILDRTLNPDAFDERGEPGTKNGLPEDPTKIAFLSNFIDGAMQDAAFARTKRVPGDSKYLSYASTAITRPIAPGEDPKTSGRVSVMALASIQRTNRSLFSIARAADGRVVLELTGRLRAAEQDAIAAANADTSVYGSLYSGALNIFSRPPASVPMPGAADTSNLLVTRRRSGKVKKNSFRRARFESDGYGSGTDKDELRNLLETDSKYNDDEYLRRLDMQQQGSYVNSASGSAFPQMPLGYFNNMDISNTMFGAVMGQPYQHPQLQQQYMYGFGGPEGELLPLGLVENLYHTSAQPPQHSRSQQPPLLQLMDAPKSPSSSLALVPAVNSGSAVSSPLRFPSSLDANTQARSLYFDSTTQKTSSSIQNGSSPTKDLKNLPLQRRKSVSMGEVDQAVQALPMVPFVRSTSPSFHQEVQSPSARTLQDLPALQGSALATFSRAVERSHPSNRRGDIGDIVQARRALLLKAKPRTVPGGVSTHVPLPVVQSFAGVAPDSEQLLSAGSRSARDTLKYLYVLRLLALPVTPGRLGQSAAATAPPNTNFRATLEASLNFNKSVGGSDSHSTVTSSDPALLTGMVDLAQRPAQLLAFLRENARIVRAYHKDLIHDIRTGTVTGGPQGVLRADQRVALQVTLAPHPARARLIALAIRASGVLEEELVSAEEVRAIEAEVMHEREQEREREREKEEEREKERQRLIRLRNKEKGIKNKPIPPLEKKDNSTKAVTPSGKSGGNDFAISARVQLLKEEREREQRQQEDREDAEALGITVEELHELEQRQEQLLMPFVNADFVPLFYSTQRAPPGLIRDPSVGLQRAELAEGVIKSLHGQAKSSGLSGGADGVALRQPDQHIFRAAAAARADADRAAAAAELQAFRRTRGQRSNVLTQRGRELATGKPFITHLNDRGELTFRPGLPDRLMGPSRAAQTAAILAGATISNAAAGPEEEDSDSIEVRTKVTLTASERAEFVKLKARRAAEGNFFVADGPKPFVCKHPGCGRAFASVGGAVRHTKTDHPVGSVVGGVPLNTPVEADHQLRDLFRMTGLDQTMAMASSQL